MCRPTAVNLHFKHFYPSPRTLHSCPPTHQLNVEWLSRFFCRLGFQIASEIDTLCEMNTDWFYSVYLIYSKTVSRVGGEEHIQCLGVKSYVEETMQAPSVGYRVWMCLSEGIQRLEVKNLWLQPIYMYVISNGCL